mmetsp:Transcript_24488/g.34225  ORF Transcript_24488/g.34225 Transcript_24488/m.34225 type:complete len:322 (-) Transcript_24488:367-1332(-)
MYLYAVKDSGTMYSALASGGNDPTQCSVHFVRGRPSQTDLSAGSWDLYLTFEPATGDRNCQKCSISASSTASGTALIAFYGSGANIQLYNSIFGSGMTLTCSSTNKCLPDYHETSGDSTCFEGSQTVQLSSGKTLPIRDVKLGDEILVAERNGTFSYSPIVYVPHQKNNRKASFVSLKTEGPEIKATPDHLILVSESCDKDFSQSQMAKVKDIATGACVWTTNGLKKVHSTSLAMGHGVYTVVAKDGGGQIVVGGIVASSFGHLHTLTNCYYHLHRALYDILPISVLQASWFVKGNELVGDIAVKVLQFAVSWKMLFAAKK